MTPWFLDPPRLLDDLQFGSAAGYARVAAQLPSLAAGLDDDHRARLYSSGGAGTLGFLGIGRSARVPEMSDLELRTAIRDRLRYDHAAFEPGLFQSTAPSTQCQKRYAAPRDTQHATNNHHTPPTRRPTNTPTNQLSNKTE